jgi:hypothetical protein
MGNGTPGTAWHSRCRTHWTATGSLRYPHHSSWFGQVYFRGHDKKDFATVIGRIRTPTTRVRAPQRFQTKFFEDYL